MLADAPSGPGFHPARMDGLGRPCGTDIDEMEDESDEDVSVPVMMYSTAICPYCDRVFADEQSAATHIKAVHNPLPGASAPA